MPLQNSYLTGLIRVLQNQIKELNTKKDDLVKTEILPKNNNIGQHTLSKPHTTKLGSIEEETVN